MHIPVWNNLKLKHNTVGMIKSSVPNVPKITKNSKLLYFISQNS